MFWEGLQGYILLNNVGRGDEKVSSDPNVNLVPRQKGVGLASTWCWRKQRVRFM